MSPKRKSERRSAPLPCDAVGPEDLIDPRLLFRTSVRRHDDRGARRLCSQVREALTYALAAACRDEVLQSLYVAAVEPAPDATRLGVTLVVSDPAHVATARERIVCVAALLREEVARSIHRRRVPELVFRVVPAADAAP
jgi:ribosome-binding factor A